MDNNIFVLILYSVLSLVLGSFISAVTYRIPRGLGFIKGRSFCDFCHKKISWYENIPVFSFVFQKAKTRCCGKKIPLRYPVIEITSLIGTMLIFIHFNNPIYYILYYLTLCIIIIDIEHQIIPDELSWLILLLSLLNSSSDIFQNIFAGLISALVFLFLNLITKGRGMGLGDVKLALPIGMFLGLSGILNWFFVTFIIGGFFAFILLVLKRVSLKSKLAFGPFMIIAFWIILFIQIFGYYKI